MQQDNKLESAPGPRMTREVVKMPDGRHLYSYTFSPTQTPKEQTP